MTAKGTVILKYAMLLGALLSFLVISTSANAKAPLILNIENSPINSSQELGVADVERAIIEGAKVRGWQPRVVEPGHIEAVLYIRSHVATVDIYFGTTSYSIIYKDSVNLDYKDGRINRNYNKWVQNLNSDIQSKIPY
jgi:hypothetical protein